MLLRALRHHVGRLAEEARLHLAFRWFLERPRRDAPDHSIAVQGAGALRPARVPGRPPWSAVRAGRPGAGRRPLRGQHAGQGQCQSWVGRRAGAAHSAAERAGYVATVWQENPVSIHAASGPSRRGGAAGAGLAGGLTAGAARRARRCTWPVRRAQQGPGAGERLGDQSHRSRRGGQARGGPPSITRRTSAWTAGGASHHRAGRDSGPRLPTSTCWTGCSRRTGTTGRTVAEVVADTKYGTHANYVALEQQGIRASIPPHSTMSDQGDYSADRFVYEFAADRYRCPTGQLLTRQGSSRTAGARGGGLIYRGRPKVCGACPVKAQCCARRPPTLVRRTMGTARPSRRLSPHATRQEAQPARAYWVETANAELKDNHGLRRAQCRGRDKVLIQALGDHRRRQEAGPTARPQPGHGGGVGPSPPFSSGPCPRFELRSGPAPFPSRARGARTPHRALLTTIPDFGKRGPSAPPRGARAVRKTRFCRRRPGY